MARALPAFDAQFTQVLEHLYDLPAAEGNWTPALTAISNFLGASSGDVSYLQRDAMLITRWHYTRLDVNVVTRYQADYMTCDLAKTHPRTPVVLAMKEGDIRADSETWSADEQRRTLYFTEFFHRFLEPDCLTSMARAGDDGRPWIILTTHFSERPDDQRRQRLRQLLPHIRRACAVEERLGASTRRAKALAAALDGIAEAVALIDAGGRVVTANRAAMNLLRQEQGLSLAHDERVLLGSPTARDAFARALAECASPILLLSAAGAAPSAQVPIPRLDQRPLVLTLQPLPSELKGPVGAVAILFIADPEAKARDVRGALRAAYRLTPTEARLVQSLSQGVSLKEFARDNTMSYETVRSHIRRIFIKTGARRQSDLVRIARNLRG